MEFGIHIERTHMPGQTVIQDAFTFPHGSEIEKEFDLFPKGRDRLLGGPGQPMGWKWSGAHGCGRLSLSSAFKAEPASHRNTACGDTGQHLPAGHIAPFMRTVTGFTFLAHGTDSIDG